MAKSYDVLKPFSHKGKNYVKGDVATLSASAAKLYSNIDFVKEVKEEEAEEAPAKQAPAKAASKK